MHGVYEILEVMSDGRTAKRTVAYGLVSAKAAVEELSKRTTNECIAVDERTRQIVAQLNLPPSKRTIKRVFQIAYDEQEGLRSAELLSSLGYGVISVLGNQAAMVLLSSLHPYDLFIVGDAAPEERRREMVDWLKARYPKVGILALNPSHRLLAHADYNAVQSDPKVWLSYVTEHMGKSASGR